MDGDTLDAVDRAILYRLQQNGRESITDIADVANVSDNTVRNRIQAMEEDGVIKGYSVDVDYDHAGIQHYYVFVCSARVSEREQLAEEVREFPDVVEVLTLMTGTNNVYVLGAGSRKNDITQLAYDLDELGLEVEDEFLIRDHVHEPFGGLRVDRRTQQ